MLPLTFKVISLKIPANNIIFICLLDLGQVILPLGLSALRQYHLPSGFINHDIAQKEVVYSVYYTESIYFSPVLISSNYIHKCKSLPLQRLDSVKV